jgi:AcrR family transcriptional regulator
MNRKEQKQKRRDEILAVGLDLFVRNGYAGTKTQDISQAAGMSEGLLFHYFETKEKLFEELIKLGVSKPQTILSGIEGEPLEFFRTAVKEILYHVSTKPFVAKMFVLISQARCNDAVPESVKKLLAGQDNLTQKKKKIRQGQRNGTIKKGNPVALVAALWGAVQGIAVQIALFPDLPVPDSEWVVDILREREIMRRSNH